MHKRPTTTRIVKAGKQGKGETQSLLMIVEFCRVQVNMPAESGEMGVLANHVPSIEQLKAGVIDIIEEGGNNKQFFSTFR